MVFGFCFSFLERKTITIPHIKPAIIGNMARLDKGVTASIVASIAEINPKVMSSFFM